MKVVVVVVVFNRPENIDKWCHCWARSNHNDCQLVVIHNHDTQENYMRIKSTVASVGGLYLPRANRGFDIGALQDVARKRMHGFPGDFEYLLWCTDDTLPMTPNFIWHFVDAMNMSMQPKVVCMELSKEVHPHVRTTGFMIHQSFLYQLRFPTDPILTKQQCYDFEHRGGSITLLNQASGHALEIADIEHSPMWDTGHRHRNAVRRYNRRKKEFDQTWGSTTRLPASVPLWDNGSQNPEVTVICPAYKGYPHIIPSMIAQTYTKWKLWLIHDGPMDKEFADVVASFMHHPGVSERIMFRCMDQRAGNWGHAIRKEFLQRADVGDLVVMTNADNYHVPTYLARMVEGFEPGIVATYCSHMVHNYKAHQIIDCQLQRGYIDAAGVMVRKEIAQQVGWSHTEDHAADWLYFKDIIDLCGPKAFKKVLGCLLVHN